MYQLNENIRKFRKERGLTQRELAEKLQISDKTVSRWESGVQVPDAETVPVLARLFHVSIGELYGEEAAVSPAEEVVSVTEKPALSFPAADRRVIRRVWLAATVSAVLLLLGTAALCLNNFYTLSIPVVGYLPYFGTTGGRMLGVVLFSAGAAALTAVLTAYRLWYRKPPCFNFRYLDTDASLHLTAVILFSALLLFVLPRFLGFAVNAPYLTVVYLAAFVINTQLMWRRRELVRRHGVKVSTAVTVVSLSLGGLSLIACFVCLDLHVFSLMEVPSLNSYGGDTTVTVTMWLWYEAALNPWFGGHYYYFLLTVSVPLTAMLLLCAIELKYRSLRLMRTYPSAETDDAMAKLPLIRKLLIGLGAAAVMAGAVFGLLNISGVLRHYATVTIMTDSMSPTLCSGDVIKVCTDVERQMLGRGDVINFRTDDGLQMIGRISRVNVSRDGEAVSYKVTQDNPDNHDKRLVDPDDIIGVWLEAPKPESSDEYEIEYADY